MTDVFSPKKRSDVMSRIRSRGNKDTELALVKIFRREKITGWRRHLEIRIAQPGKKPTAFRVRPDFVFREVRLAVFVDGCFWHGCPKHSSKPKNNAEFWEKKLEGNRARDRLVNRVLRRDGWKVLRIWEHELTPKNVSRCTRRIRAALELKQG